MNITESRCPWSNPVAIDPETWILNPIDALVSLTDTRAYIASGLLHGRPLLAVLIKNIMGCIQYTLSGMWILVTDAQGCLNMLYLGHRVLKQKQNHW